MPSRRSPRGDRWTCRPTKAACAAPGWVGGRAAGGGGGSHLSPVPALRTSQACSRAARCGPDPYSPTYTTPPEPNPTHSTPPLRCYKPPCRPQPAAPPHRLPLPTPQVETELHRERNIRPSFGLGAGLYGGLAYSALDAYLLRGPLQPRWTFRHRWAGLGWAGRERAGGPAAPGRLRLAECWATCSLAARGLLSCCCCFASQRQAPCQSAQQACLWPLLWWASAAHPLPPPALRHASHSLSDLATTRSCAPLRSLHHASTPSPTA